jgi:hypothetical protein
MYSPEAGRSFPDTTFPELASAFGGFWEAIGPVPELELKLQSRVSQIISPRVFLSIIETSTQLKVGSEDPRSVNPLTKSLHTRSIEGVFLLVCVGFSVAFSSSPIR